MTVVVQARDRCRICFSLLLRDRSICCQKFYHLFKHVERRKIPFNKLNSYPIKIRTETVCFRDLILRYVRTHINETKNSSNFICQNCSMILLDIEQCAKYLRKSINQIKLKLNKSNRLRTSSLSATFQKKKGNHENINIQDELLHINNSDSDDEFNDIDDEESDDEQNISKGNLTTNVHSLKQSTNLDCMSQDEDEDGQIKTSSTNDNLKSTGNNLSLMEETNPNLFSLRLAHYMAAASTANSTNINLNLHDNNNNHTNPMLSTLANLQRNIFLQFMNDPLAAAHAIHAAATAASVSTTPIKASMTPTSSITSNIKQTASSRKRKTTPKRTLPVNHRSSNNINTDDISFINEAESNDDDDNNNNNNNTNTNTDSSDYPLELTLKSIQQSNRISSSPKIKLTPEVHNLVKNCKIENGSPSHYHQTMDEERKESMTPNDSLSSLSPLLTRRSTPKRQRTSISGQYDYSNNTKLNISQTSADLLSPNHQTINNDDMNALNQQKQTRKLETHTCAECGKVLFSDKTLLLHCQTHAKNEKQCWICGIHDDDIKKHINTEHGNQKFTQTGFKCQHCEKVFPVYADLEAHTREHNKKKPFQCPICNKRFGQQGNLSCHLRIHSGVKPFHCSSCGKAFRHSNSLRRHARTVHSASRSFSMNPISIGATTPSSSLLLAAATTSNSMVSMANDVNRLNTTETFDDGNSQLMIPSDEADSLQGPPSTSTAGAPSPSVSNAQMDSDSHEQYGTG